jgi:hypothetical protein
MILDDTTVVYIVHKNGLPPNFGKPIIPDDLSFGVARNIRETTLAELSARINAKVVNVGELLISTDIDALNLNEINERANLIQSISISVDKLDIKMLRLLKSHIKESYENRFQTVPSKNVPWQSFNRPSFD